MKVHRLSSMSRASTVQQAIADETLAAKASWIILTLAFSN